MSDGALHRIHVWADRGRGAHRIGLDGCNAQWTLRVDGRRRWPRLVDSKRTGPHPFTLEADRGTVVRLGPHGTGDVDGAPLAVDRRRRAVTARVDGELLLDVARAGFAGAVARTPAGTRVLGHRALTGAAVCPAAEGEAVVSVAVALWLGGWIDGVAGWPVRLLQWL